MSDIRSNQTLLKIADEETGEALKIVDSSHRPDHTARAQRLASICRILFMREQTQETQFKRTLTCYYAARGDELVTNDPLQARGYYLLFLQMLYQEKMIEYLKAIAPLENWVLATFFTTYSDKPVRIRREHSDTTSSENMLYSAALLLKESPRKFLTALLDLYIIESDFIRSLLANLRTQKRNWFMIQRADTVFALDYLNTDSTELLRDTVEFAIEAVPMSIGTDLLLDFMLSLVDVKDVAQPVLEDFERVLTPARQFANAQNIMQKSTLYTDVDREFLETMRVVDRILGKMRGVGEKSRSKAARLRKFLGEIKQYVDRMHREFFRNAELEVKINTFSLPRNILSPLEIQIKNSDFGPATNVVLNISKDPSFQTKDYAISLEPIFGKDERIEAFYISPVIEKTVELRGVIEYSSQEDPKKTVRFQHTINVSDPDYFKPFKIPYITGGPVRTSEMFFGRRDELEEIIRLLMGHFQDRIVVIHGQRRVGKTSVLFQLKEGNPDLLGVPTLRAVQKQYIPIFIDFERFTDENVATWSIYYHIYRNLREGLDEFDIRTVAIEMKDFRDLSGDALLENFIIQVKQLLAPNGRKLLLMFDEFDTLIRYKSKDKSLFGLIRELIIKHSKEISFIFVGADQLVAMMETYTERLYAMAGMKKEIGKLSSEEARCLVIEPMKKVNPEFEWAEDAVQLITRATAENPHYIQTLCDRIVNNLIIGKRLRATTIDVEQGIKEVVLDIRGGDFKRIIEELNNVEEKIVLTCVADLTQTPYIRMEQSWTTGGAIERRIKDFSRSFPSESIPRILRSLHSRYILDQRPDEDLEMKYSIQVPLLQFYIQNKLKLKDVLREGGYV